MPSSLNQRVESIDLLKGLVMVIMALDHVRDYFHYSSFFFDPGDFTQTTLPIFFTRWITHFCAPSFSFLAGLSAFMVGKRKSKNQLSGFLVKRGLWLIFIEMTVVNFAWFFDIHFSNPALLVIWSLGISMIVLAAIIHLPKPLILLFSLLLICGHNLLDNISFNQNFLWSVLHQLSFFQLSDDVQLAVLYPVIPWIAVMSLGYYFGYYYLSSVAASWRKKTFNLIGVSALILFFVLRYINHYGDPVPWTNSNSFSKDLISFLNPTKYPPSLSFLLMTLGFAFIFLANGEKWKGKLVDFFCTFGRVPFFYYILHIYLIHLAAMLLAEITGFGWQAMILKSWVTQVPALKGYGIPLWGVYVVWIGIVVLLYPLCKRFDRYKQAHKEKWWLSYL